MRSIMTLAVSMILVLLAAACDDPGATTPVPAATPTPLAATTTPINNIDFVWSVPSPGGSIHTGQPNPMWGPTTGLTMTFMATSVVDRVARFQVSLSGPENGVCLTNALGASAPVIQLTAGVPVTITIREMVLTSVCRRPNNVNVTITRLMPAASAEPEPIPFYEERFALQYSVVE